MQMAKIINEESSLSLQDLAAKFVKLAKEGGTKDNTTVLIIELKS